METCPWVDVEADFPKNPSRNRMLLPYSVNAWAPSMRAHRYSFDQGLLRRRRFDVNERGERETLRGGQLQNHRQALKSTAEELVAAHDAPALGLDLNRQRPTLTTTEFRSSGTFF
jgi:hypothetical protein